MKPPFPPAPLAARSPRHGRLPAAPDTTGIQACRQDGNAIPPFLGQRAPSENVRLSRLAELTAFPLEIQPLPCPPPPAIVCCVREPLPRTSSNLPDCRRRFPAVCGG